MDDQDHNTRPRRGRPPGANRTPLDQTERKKRNATYEKDRRVLIGKGITILEQFVGANASTPRAEVIARTVHFIVALRENIDELRAETERLKEEVEECERKQRAAELRIAWAKGPRAPKCQKQAGGSCQEVAPKPEVKEDPEPLVDPVMFEAGPEEPKPSLLVPIPLATPDAPVPEPIPWLEESPLSLEGDEPVPSLFPDLMGLPYLDHEDTPPD